MKVLSGIATLLLFVPLTRAADPPSDREAATAELERLIHKAIVAKAPPPTRTVPAGGTPSLCRTVWSCGG